MADLPVTDSSGSPQLDALLRLLPKPPREVLIQTRQWVERMHKIFQGQLRYREQTPTTRQHAAQAEKSFRKLMEMLATLPQPQPLRDQWRSLVEALDALRQEDDGKPVYSRSPFMNQVRWVAAAHQRGNLAREPLRDTLVEMENYLRRVSDSVKTMPGHSRQTEMNDCLQRMRTAIREAQQHLHLGNLSAMEQRLQDATADMERLVDIQEFLVQTESRPAQRPCLRCGAPNATSGRNCGQCGARMLSPPWENDMQTMLDVRVGDEGILVNREQTETTQKLVDTVADYRARKIGQAQFDKVLTETSGKIKKARSEVARLQSPQTAAESQAREQMLEGLSLMEQGLRELRSAQLDSGLDMALRGADLVRAVQRQAEKA